MRKFLSKFKSGAKALPAFIAWPFRREIPPTRNMARTGDARYVPQMATWRPKLDGTRVQMANRLDDIDWRDYDRVRFYPVIRDGIRSIVAPASRANIHFTCDDPKIAELAQQELGPLVPGLVKQLLRGALEFGYHAAEIRWVAKFDVLTSSGLSQGNGQERSERYYPFIWTVSRLAHFHPIDTRILIDTATGDFAGIRQFQGLVSRGNRDVPARKCVIYTHDKEFDMNYGVALTKPAVPFVDVAISLFDSMSKYADLFAVPGMIGRYPMGRTAFQDGSVMENSEIMQSLLESIGSGHRMSLPSNTWDTGPMKWDVSFFAPVSTAQPYTDMLGLVNDQIRLAIGVNEMASSDTTKVGGLGDQGAEDKIGLFLANIESYLDELKTQVDKIANQFRIYNFGHDAPPLKVYFEPVDMNVTKALLAAVVEILSSGQPIQDSGGNLIYPDWGKILQDKGIPVVSVSGKRLAQQLLDAANQQMGAQRNPTGGEGGAAGEELIKGLKPDTPEMELAAKKEAHRILKLAILGVETAPAIRAKLTDMADSLATTMLADWGVNWPTEEMDPAAIQVHPDMQYKDGAEGEGNTRPWVDDAPPYNPAASSPLLVWEANDGARYVVDGHHRRQMALNQGLTAVPVRVIREANGVSFADAKNLGVAENVRKGTFAEWDEGKHPRNPDGTFKTKEQLEAEERLGKSDEMRRRLRSMKGLARDESDETLQRMKKGAQEALANGDRGLDMRAQLLAVQSELDRRHLEKGGDNHAEKSTEVSTVSTTKQLTKEQLKGDAKMLQESAWTKGRKPTVVEHDGKLWKVTRSGDGWSLAPASREDLMPAILKKVDDGSHRLNSYKAGLDAPAAAPEAPDTPEKPEPPKDETAANIAGDMESLSNMAEEYRSKDDYWRHDPGNGRRMKAEMDALRRVLPMEENQVQVGAHPRKKGWKYATFLPLMFTPGKEWSEGTSLTYQKGTKVGAGFASMVASQMGMAHDAQAMLRDFARTADAPRFVSVVQKMVENTKGTYDGHAEALRKAIEEVPAEEAGFKTRKGATADMERALAERLDDGSGYAGTRRFNHRGNKALGQGDVVRLTYDGKPMKPEMAKEFTDGAHALLDEAKRLGIASLQAIVPVASNRCAASMGEGVLSYNKYTTDYLKEPDKPNRGDWTNTVNHLMDTNRDVFMATMWHEFAHHIHQMTDVSGQSAPVERRLQEFYTAKARVHYDKHGEAFKRNASKEELQAITDAFWPSKYSRTNSKEWFAECYSLHKMGKKEHVPAEFYEFISTDPSLKDKNL